MKVVEQCFLFFFMLFIFSSNVQISENIKMAVAAKLLASVYRSMDEFQQNEGVLETLSSLRMIPLASGEFVAISDSTLFFPFEQTHKDSSRTQGIVLKFFPIS